MGQQQVLLIILITIVVGIATIVAINSITNASEASNLEAIKQDIIMAQGNSMAFFTKPVPIGGGGNTFLGITLRDINLPVSNDNADYVIGDITATDFQVIATSAYGTFTLTGTISTIISKRVATTDILLINGEATAIAGLYRTEETSVRRGVPILKDLPPWFFGLRYLFGYNSDDYLENELVILIQAELERPLRERIANKLNSKNEVLTRERDRMRADMDLVLPQDLREIPKPKTVVPSVVEEKVDTVALEVKVIEQEIVLEDEVTEEQLKEAEELSIPISNPELMVVVPKAFSLEEYLKMRENGEYVDDKSDNNLKYFVIGGAFLVPNNALNFQKTLESKSYNTRLLHNTETKFNYVAYYSFNNIEEAISTTRRMQRQVNPDIWMFTFKPESTEMRNGGKY